MRKRNKFQKITMILLAAMILLFSVMMGVSRGKTGVEFHDALLKVQGTPPDNGAYFGKAHGEDVSIVVLRESETEIGMSLCVGDFIHEHWLVEYPLEPIPTERDETKPGLRVHKEGQLVFEGAYDPADYSDAIGHILYDKNGEWTIDSSFGTHTYTSDNYWQHYETGIGTVLEFVNGPELTARGSWQTYAMATLVAVMALVMVAFPRELFELGYHRYVKDPEPTEFYFVMHYFSCCLLTAVALVTYIMGIRQLP